MKKLSVIVFTLLALLALLAACQTAASPDTEVDEPGVAEEVTGPEETELVVEPEVTEVLEEPEATEVVEEVQPTAAEETVAVGTPLPETGATPAAGEAACVQEDLTAAGQEIYTTTCAVCHGQAGEGQGDFPALTGNELVSNVESTEMLQEILNPAVHPFVETFTDEQVAAAATYSRSEFGDGAGVVCPADVTAVRATP